MVEEFREIAVTAPKHDNVTVSLLAVKDVRDIFPVGVGALPGPPFSRYSWSVSSTSATCSGFSNSSPAW
eukprot:SAG11_NODE_921_length_6541_cov_9.172462_4_plen_69_part_00